MAPQIKNILLSVYISKYCILVYTLLIEKEMVSYYICCYVEYILIYSLLSYRDISFKKGFYLLKYNRR